MAINRKQCRGPLSIGSGVMGQMRRKEIQLRLRGARAPASRALFS